MSQSVPESMQGFHEYHAAFQTLIGPDASLDLLMEKDYPFAHEAGIYIPASNTLFITSNMIFDEPGRPRVEISKVTFNTDGKAKLEQLDCPSIALANGGVNYGDNKILICDQGTGLKSSALVVVDINPPYNTEVLVSKFEGRPFNAVNDVVLHSDGSVWFTDPCYGHDAGYKPKPVLPNHVYRYDPTTKSLRAIADGIGRPNGLCFSPDEKVLYVTDTDKGRGFGDIDETRPSSIYAFDVETISGQPFLTNRRLFAFVAAGFPDGIKCDMEGNVYSGCGDGLHIWSSGGVLLGKILLPAPVGNFCFGKPGEMFLLNQKRLWRVKLKDSVRGALLKL